MIASLVGRAQLALMPRASGTTIATIEAFADMVYVTVPRNGQEKHVRNVHVPKIVTSTVVASPPGNVYACRAGPVLRVARAVLASVLTVASATPAR